MPLMDDAGQMAQAAYGRLQRMAGQPFSPMTDAGAASNPQTQPNAVATPPPQTSNMAGNEGGSAYGQSDVDTASQYLVKLFGALQGQAHGILNAWNVVSDPHGSDPYFQAAYQHAGPGPFQAAGGALNPALKNDPAFKKAVWDAISSQVGGGGSIFGHMLAGVLGQGEVGGYDVARGWPRGGGVYSGDPGLKAGGFDPNNLPDWYRKAVARATGVA